MLLFWEMFYARKTPTLSGPQRLCAAPKGLAKGQGLRAGLAPENRRPEEGQVRVRALASFSEGVCVLFLSGAAVIEQCAQVKRTIHPTLPRRAQEKGGLRVLVSCTYQAGHGICSIRGCASWIMLLSQLDSFA